MLPLLCLLVLCLLNRYLLLVLRFLILVKFFFVFSSCPTTVASIPLSPPPFLCVLYANQHPYAIIASKITNSIFLTIFLFFFFLLLFRSFEVIFFSLKSISWLFSLLFFCIEYISSSFLVFVYLLLFVFFLYFFCSSLFIPLFCTFFLMAFGLHLL